MEITGHPAQLLAEIIGHPAQLLFQMRKQLKAHQTRWALPFEQVSIYVFLEFWCAVVKSEACTVIVVR